MYSHETKIRIRYGETDRMGYAHHANFPLYLEEARMELLRSIGLNYKDLEDSGIIMPVLKINIKFSSPTFYDDIISITTIIRDMPVTRLHLEYIGHNKNNKIICRADTELVFVDAKTRKPMRAPKIITEKLKEKLKYSNSYRRWKMEQIS